MRALFLLSNLTRLRHCRKVGLVREHNRVPGPHPGSTGRQTSKYFSPPSINNLLFQTVRGFSRDPNPRPSEQKIQVRKFVQMKQLINFMLGAKAMGSYDK